MSTIVVPNIPTNLSLLDDETLTAGGPDLAAHPGYFRARQQVAWERFEKLPMPARNDEAWRFANVKAIDLAPFKRAFPITDAECAALVARSTGLDETSGRMVFANDRLLARQFHGDSLRAKGVLWLPLEQAIAEQRELIEKHFLREDAILGSRKFAALHEAQVRNGTFLHVPRGVEIALPIEAFHWLGGENASIFPHTLIIADEMSKVTLVDYFQSSGDDAGLACGVNDIVVGNGAKVTYVAVQQWNAKTLAFHLNNTTVARDASALALALNLGGQMSAVKRSATCAARAGAATCSASPPPRACRCSTSARCKFTRRRTPRAICSTRIR